MGVCANHRDLHNDSKTINDSCIRFYKGVLVSAIPNGKTRQTYHTLILTKVLIVLTQTGHIHQYRRVLKAMDPLPPLAPLPTSIKHVVVQLTHLNHNFGYSRSRTTRPQNVIVGGQISGARHAFYGVKVVRCRIVQLKFS
jgi:hypothetical protein